MNGKFPQFLFFFYVAALSLPLLGQQTIKGRVLDAQTNDPLIGAAIGVENTTIGTMTQGDGTFELAVDESGTVSLLVSFVGYQDQRTTVKANAKSVDIRLRSISTELDAVVVTGIAEDQIKAMVEMKQAENIKNIVSAAQIKTFPDLNAAEVMQRIPGITLQRDQGEGRFVQLRGTPPELTNFNINGEQVPSPEGDFRYVGMDIIPSDQIESIEVTKVMTPDMDGDGIGGSVNIKTKRARGGQPEIRATLAGGYNNLRETPNYNLQFSYGQRYNKLGFQLNASFFENQQGADNIEYKFTKGPFFNSDDQGQGVDNFNLHYREAQLRHYEITRRRISVSPTLDYEFNDKSRVYLQGMYNSFSDDETRRRLIYDLEDPLNATYFPFWRCRTRRKRPQANSILEHHCAWRRTSIWRIHIGLPIVLLAR